MLIPHLGAPWHAWHSEADALPLFLLLVTSLAQYSHPELLVRSLVTEHPFPVIHCAIKPLHDKHKRAQHANTTSHFCLLLNQGKGLIGFFIFSSSDVKENLSVLSCRRQSWNSRSGPAAFHKELLIFLCIPVMIPSLVPLFKADKFMFWGCIQGRIIFNFPTALCGDMAGWRIGRVERVSALNILWKGSSEEPLNFGAEKKR